METNETEVRLNAILQNIKNALPDGYVVAATDMPATSGTIYIEATAAGVKAAPEYDVTDKPMTNDLIGKRVSVLDKGWLELVDLMPHPAADVSGDLAIVNAARVSYLGESKGDEADKKLLFYLMRNRHSTPFEVCEFVFRVHAPLFVARQWMRHRTWSYNEVSRRYTSEGMEFYVPTEWRAQSDNNKQGSDGSVVLQSHQQYMVEEVLKQSVWVYQRMIELGVAREQARMVLPQGMYTTFIAKVDAHNLMHFLRLRMDEHAQYEIRVYARAIYEHFFRSALPWTAEAFELYQLGGDND